MKKFLLILCLMMPFCKYVYSQCLIDKSNWTLIFNEEFNGTVQDLQNNWYYEYTYGSVHNPGGSWFESYNTPNNITVSNGLAYFNTNKVTTPINYNGINYYYTSAMLRSKFADYQICDNSTDNDKSGFLYGMFEIRCKLPKKNGQAPAFWLTGNNAWPPEIDGFEYNGNNHNSFFSTVHWLNSNNTNQGASNIYNYPFDLTDDFHTYTVVWTPTKITWFFEGRELKSDNLITHLPGSGFTNNFERCKWSKMDIIIQSSLNYPDASETSFDPLIVDYIKVYRPNGLPAFNSGQDFDSYFNNTLFPIYANTPFKPAQDWMLRKIIAPTNTYNSYSDLNVLQNGGKFYYKGDNNLLWTTYWYDYGSGGAYYAAQIDWYHPITGSISVSSPNPSTEIPFFISGSLIQYYQNGQFHDINYYQGIIDPTNSDGEINVVSPKLFSDSAGLQVLYLGSDNNLWLYSRTILSKPFWLRTQITFTGDVTPEIAVTPNNFNTAFYKNTSSQLVRINFSSFSTSSTIISSVNDIFSSISVSPSGGVVYYKNQNNEMYYYSLTNSGWSRSGFTAIYPWSNGQSLQVYNVSADIQIGENPGQVYYLGTDNRVWVLYQDQNNIWQAVAINWTFNNAVRDLRITNAINVQRRLSFVGSDNQIRVFNYDYCEILNPQNGSVTSFSVKNKNTNNLNTETNDLKSNKNIKPIELKLWPNPSSRELDFYVDSFVGGKVLVTIFDSKGLMILQEKRLFGKASENILISHLAKGAYFLHLTSQNNVVTGKFIKE
ncbi:MAG: family 16 glycosylhydrolase [Bacteroidetes bacterium]|nr:family 16 glycosylhydrolase [Bacteroidota bacterium]